jgi:hypothetical protein
LLYIAILTSREACAWKRLRHSRYPLSPPKSPKVFKVETIGLLGVDYGGSKVIDREFILSAGLFSQAG